ncbi:hypothetical protein [Catellatospora sichuanensis]|uniref:hypothetical protein n=1 Tax=Catellatospora sichuanensis TaxID=1969805 RepID=UPI0011838657|nr:hypothetical protein [Catellatospora sichuanensis]
MKLFLIAVALLIVVLAVVAGRRGKRHGHINPPENYYDGNAMIHAARQTGGADGPNKSTG